MRQDDRNALQELAVSVMDGRQRLRRGTSLRVDQNDPSQSYEIEGELGRGGFALTYRAHDRASGRTVAMKEYFPCEVALRDGATSNVRPSSARFEKAFYEGLQRFIREGNVLAMFRHPNIVRVHRLFQANNTAYLALSFERGTSLREWLHSLGRPPTQAELDRLLKPLLQALRVVHMNRMLHRDIAPDNIFVREGLDPVLLDFGSARRAEGIDGRALTKFVKEGFSPVEQYMYDVSEQGPWTDIYALAATLYYAVCGASPPSTSSRYNQDTLVSALRAARGNYRPAFLAAIDHGLQLSVGDRPRSIERWSQQLFANELPRTALPRTGSADEPLSAAPSAETGGPGLAPQPGLLSRIASWLR